MPIYEYHCEKCDSDFERLVKNDKESVACECGNDKVERRWSVFAAHTAGGGSSSSAAAPAPACTSCCSGGACGLS